MTAIIEWRSDLTRFAPVFQGELAMYAYEAANDNRGAIESAEVFQAIKAAASLRHYARMATTLTPEFKMQLRCMAQAIDQQLQEFGINRGGSHAV